MSDPEILARLEALETEHAVRQLVMRYFRICDDLGPETPFDELGALFAEDALWEGRGRYAKAFGRYEGREAIVAMIRSYCLPQPHFAMTAHFLSSEQIESQQDSASGQWMMLQTTDYADGRADYRGAHISVRCERTGSTWRIASFLTRNLFSRQVEPWSDEAMIPVPETSNTRASA